RGLPGRPHPAHPADGRDARRPLALRVDRRGARRRAPPRRLLALSGDRDARRPAVDVVPGHDRIGPPAADAGPPRRSLAACLILGARPVLGRFAPCALPMPPDPVARPRRSRRAAPLSRTGYFVSAV